MKDIITPAIVYAHIDCDFSSEKAGFMYTYLIAGLITLAALPVNVKRALHVR